MIYDIRFTSGKVSQPIQKLASLCLLAAILVLYSSGLVRAQTPVFYSSPGQTNQVVLTAWPPPPSGNTWVQYGTNTIYLGIPLTNTPNAGGFFSNSFYPTLYKVSIPALGSGAFFYANIYNTTNYSSLGFYATNIVVANNVSSSAQLIAQMLGYTPQPLLAYQPATNNPQAFIWNNVVAVTGITNASGVWTNATVTLQTNSVNYQRP